MSSSNRRPYLTATALTQEFLDFCQDNLDIDLRFVVEIDAPEAFAESRETSIAIGSPAIFSSDNHGFIEGQAIVPTTTGTLPAPLVSGSTFYAKSVTAHTFRVSLTSGGAAINLASAGSPTHYFHEKYPKIRASNRNTFVGERFYEALTTLPVISRTVGEWLGAALEFSSLDVAISNADGRYNSMLPGGEDYAGMIGRRVVVKVGVRDVEATFRTIFEGSISPEGGFRRELSSIKVTARDKFEALNRDFPAAVATKADFPNLADDKVGEPLAIIYGDWTVNVRDEGSVTTLVVNNEDPDVNGEASNTVNVQVLIANNELSFFDDAQVYVQKGTDLWPIDPSDIVTSGPFVGAGPANARFEVIQDSGATQVNDPPENYLYEVGDEFLVKVKGKTLAGGYDNNAVWQARDLLINYAGASPADFAANWATYRDKASPSQSAISTIKSRIYVKNVQGVMEYVASLLEQVRLEFCIDKNLELKIVSNHPEDWPASPSHRVRQWDISKDTLQPQSDQRNNFNRVQAYYNYDPQSNSENYATRWQKNQAAIDQTGRSISKIIFYPNLHIEAEVVAQLQEVLKLASSYNEIIPVTLSARAMLLDIGDFVKMSVSISGTEFRDVPMMIRDIGYDPSGSKMPVKLWSFQMFPYGAWNPGYTGIVGGTSATITEE